MICKANCENITGKPLFLPMLLITPGLQETPCLIFFRITIYCSVQEDQESMEAPPEKMAEYAGSSIVDLFHYAAAEKQALLSALLGTFAVIAIAVAISRVMRKTADRCQRKNSTWRKVTGQLLLPLIAAAGVTGVFLVWEPLKKSWHPQWVQFDLQIFYALLTICAVWGGCRVIGLFNLKLRDLAERNDNRLDKLTVSMIGNTLKTALILTAVLFIGQNIFHFNITALLASAGVIGLSLALAAKDTVSNFFGTLVITADSPFRIGDRIECEKINGIVLNVGMRSSRIKLDDESVCTVPNSILSNSIVRRIDCRGVLKHELTLQLVYSTSSEDMKKASALLHSLLDDFHGSDLPGNEPHIFFASFGEYSLNIHIIIWLKCRTFAEAEILIDELNNAILSSFNAAGLIFAYPTQTVKVEK